MAEDGERPIDDALLDQRRQESLAAFADGQYLAALSAMQRGVLATGLKWFAEEGVHFARPEEETPTASLLIGLAIAAGREVEERGEEAPFRLQIAAQALSSIAALRAAYERPIPATVNELSERLAELILLASDVGRMDIFMVQVRNGLLEQLSALEKDREKRSLGARIANQRKATKREQALGEAIKITGTNRTLSNEELGEMVRARLRLDVTIRTATDWVRDWRRAGMVPPRSVSAR